MIAIAASLAALFALHAVISILFLARAERVVSFIAAIASKRNGAYQALMRGLANSPPYAWLLAGRGWDSFVQVAPSRPKEFKRLTTGIRILGALSLTANVSIVLFTLVRSLAT